MPQVCSSPEDRGPPPGRKGLRPTVLEAPGLRGSCAVLRSAPPARLGAPAPQRAPASAARPPGKMCRPSPAARPPSTAPPPGAAPPRPCAVPPRRAAPPFPAPRPRRAPGRFSAEPPQPRSANAGSARSPAPSARPQPKQTARSHFLPRGATFAARADSGHGRKWLSEPAQPNLPDRAAKGRSQESGRGLRRPLQWPLAGSAPGWGPVHARAQKSPAAGSDRITHNEAHLLLKAGPEGPPSHTCFMYLWGVGSRLFHKITDRRALWGPSLSTRLAGPCSVG